MIHFLPLLPLISMKTKLSVLKETKNDEFCCLIKDYLLVVPAVTAALHVKHVVQAAVKGWVWMTFKSQDAMVFIFKLYMYSLEGVKRGR